MTTIIVILLVLFFGIAILKNVLKIIFLVIALVGTLVILDSAHIIDIKKDVFGESGSIHKEKTPVHKEKTPTHKEK